jgi:sugar phosphate isomerase/epimerase
MMIAIHTAPVGFFESSPPHTNSELFRFVRKAASLGFKGFQVGPLSDFVNIDGKGLKRALDDAGMERNVHVGGLFDAKNFALRGEEFEKAHVQIRRGIELCSEISSELVSFHPPFFTSEHAEDKVLLRKARIRFSELVNEEVEFAYDWGTRVALESFCYRPFIFNGLDDLMKFTSNFPSKKFGILLEAGHLYQARLNLAEAVQTFKNRLLDVHVHDATRQRDFKKATHLPIGKGTLDFSRLVCMLGEVKYEGWLTLEVRGNDREIVESKEHLENLVEQLPHHSDRACFHGISPAKNRFQVEQDRSQGVIGLKARSARV